MREQYINSIISMLAQIEDVRFLNRIQAILKRHIKREANSMDEEKSCKYSIVKMVFSIRNVEWLEKIYSFVKVFADDKEGSV